LATEDSEGIFHLLLSAGVDLIACKEAGEALLMEVVSREFHSSQATACSDDCTGTGTGTNAPQNIILSAVAGQRLEKEQEEEQENEVFVGMKEKKSFGDKERSRKRAKAAFS
jgi:hypothetical protein